MTLGPNPLSDSIREAGFSYILMTERDLNQSLHYVLKVIVVGLVGRGEKSNHLTKATRLKALIEGIHDSHTCVAE